MLLTSSFLTIFSTAISLNGEVVTRQPLIKSMRVVKKETLKLISGWVERSNDANMVLENFIPPLLDAVLLDYQRCTVPAAREPEVLVTMSTTVNKLKGTITPQIPKIFDAVFECTLEMINKVCTYSIQIRKLGCLSFNKSAATLFTMHPCSSRC